MSTLDIILMMSVVIVITNEFVPLSDHHHHRCDSTLTTLGYPLWCQTGSSIRFRCRTRLSRYLRTYPESSKGSKIEQRSALFRESDDEAIRDHSDGPELQCRLSMAWTTCPDSR